MNSMMQCTMREREREFRDSGSVANTEICFEIRATDLRPRLHTEGFSLYVHTGIPIQGTSTEDLANTVRSTQLLSLTNTTSTQEARHNNNYLSQRDKALSQITTITSTLRGIPKAKKDYNSWYHKQTTLVITKTTNQFFSQNKIL